MQHLDPSLLYNAPDVEPYVFISYCHKDTQKVLPLIYQLNQANYRFWYDRGIEAGDEWANTIAERLSNCGVFVAMMSHNSAKSESCLDEIAMAKRFRKDSVVIYLEPEDDVNLPNGTLMHILRYQHLFRDNYDTDEELMQELFRASIMQKCRKPAEEPPVTKVQVSQPVVKAPEPQPKPKAKGYGIVYDPKEFQIEGTTLVKVLHPRETVVVPDGVTCIGGYAFTDEDLDNNGGWNRRTTEIQLPETVTGLSRNAISSCRALQTINLPFGLKTIKEFAFCNCFTLRKNKIPQEIQYIGYGAFCGCLNLVIHMSRHTDTSKFHERWNPDHCPIEYYD